MPTVESFVPSPLVVQTVFDGKTIVVDDVQNFDQDGEFADDIRLAIREYKNKHDKDGQACDTYGCPNRVDYGDGYRGYCADCADRLEAMGYFNVNAS
jgi:hypothetical protein